jgi:hypothetical protein
MVRAEHPPSFGNVYNFAFLNRSALVITETELRLMAAAAKTGWSIHPVKG